MIASVIIQGFQSHVDSRFNLSSGLTVLTGPTDSGKTAFIRAIRWVAFNEPAGDTFVNQAAGEASVSLTLGDGTVIAKTRKKGGRTVYRLNESVFEQADVPPEVTSALGITRQTFGDFETALNFAFQLDAPFLISEPPSAGAKVLGKIAGTEIVDQAIKSVAKDTYAARQEKLQADKRIEALTEDLTQYADVNLWQNQVDACELLIQQLDRQQARRDTLSDLQSQNNACDRKISMLAAVMTLYEGLPAAAKKLAASENEVLRMQAFSDLGLRHEQLKLTIVRLSEQVKQFSALGDASRRIATLEGNMAPRLQSLQGYSSVHDLAINAIKKADSVIESTQNTDVAAASLTGLQGDSFRLNALGILWDEYQKQNATVVMRLNLLEHLRGIVQAEPMLAGLDAQRGRLERLQELHGLFRIKDGTYQEAGRKAIAATSAVESQEQVIKELWAEVDICPLCEQPIMKGAQNHGH